MRLKPTATPEWAWQEAAEAEMRRERAPPPTTRHTSLQSEDIEFQQSTTRRYSVLNLQHSQLETDRARALSAELKLCTAAVITARAVWAGPET